MIDNKNGCCIIGGDKRFVYLGRMLIDDGFFVTYYGLERDGGAQPDFASLEIAVSKCGSVILPMPLTKDGETVNTPLSDIRVPLDEKLGALLAGKRVYTANAEKLTALCGISGCDITDYSKDEALAVSNAVPTAEGALAAAVMNSEITLHGSRCLVAGAGRIGKLLSADLSALGAHVSVSARKSSDLAWINAMGCRAVSAADIKTSGEYDFIFNTVPARIFDADTLSRCAAGGVFIELASAPGGADKEDCRALMIKYVPALGLPGKTAAKTAARIIHDTIFSERA